MALIYRNVDVEMSVILLHLGALGYMNNKQAQ